MKAVIAFVAIAFIVILSVPQSTAKQCAIVCNTLAQANVCGKTGTTCRHFPNNCKRKLFNCLYDKSFAKVDISRCRGIKVGTKGICRVLTNPPTAPPTAPPTKPPTTPPTPPPTPPPATSTGETTTGETTTGETTTGETTTGETTTGETSTG